MHLKGKVLLAVGTLTGLVGTALGASTNSTNISLTPDTDRGMEYLATLPYIDKLQMIIDVVFALVPYIAILALGLLAIKYYTGGWDSVENEIRTRKGFFSIILIVLLLKVGAAMVRLISEW